MSEIIITENNFEAEVLKSSMPVLVDFWAEWCGPCQMLGPVVSELATELTDWMKVGKINVDNNHSLAVKYGVVNIPTLILFKDGAPIKTIVGYHTKEEIIGLIR